MKNWTGTLLLETEERMGKTVASNVFFQGALKVMRPVYHDPGKLCYYILNPGGGYLDGDRYRLKFTLDKQSKMTLTTQSATKVYKTPKDYAYQETEIFLKDGSYLEYITDPLIAYRQAKYIQKNIVHMEKGTTYLYSDIVTPGWSPDGEHFSYDHLQLIHEVYMDGELAVFDHIKLSPDSQKMGSIGMMEGFSHMGSMMVIDERINQDLIDRLYDVMKTSTQAYKAGISLLAVPGLTIRVLADSTQVIEQLFAACHQILSKEWFHASPSFLRKY